MRLEELPKRILVGPERKVSNPKSGRRRVRRSVRLVLPLGSVVPRCSSGSVVDPNLSTVNLKTLHLEALGSALLVGKVNVTHSLRSTGLSVHLDPRTGDLSATGELRLEPVLVDVPREVSDPESRVRGVSTGGSSGSTGGTGERGRLVGELGSLGGSLVVVGLSLAC